uniref:Uncharacterized protein n=1 Tax=Triticum urartu TaxID=4572 RepID=A0A8R7QCZ7_TRIUA
MKEWIFPLSFHLLKPSKDITIFFQIIIITILLIIHHCSFSLHRSDLLFIFLILPKHFNFLPPCLLHNLFNFHLLL